ncbi:type II secretion system F family protein [Nesterenkonia sp.]|uniref:type II secretion system F family protein n=1 Tax=Nesterenkonia sp. TaxID=704201 RepID=UPI002624F6E4|nr:type II secretion system F family protein [Nesterenkonia sp.]
MMWLPAAAAGLGLGTGLLLIFGSLTSERASSARQRRASRRIRTLLDQAGHQNLPVSAPVTATALSALAGFAAVYTLTRTGPVALCFALFASALPWVVLRWQASRRREALAEVWPDVVDHLRSAIRSGLSLPEGLMELGRAGPEPLREPFADFSRDWRSGMAMGPALARLKDRLADPVGDRIIMALQITRELGGTDLGRLLGTLADVLRENARTRSELRARQSWTVNGARIAVAAPWFVVLLLATRPEAAEAYRGPAGMAVLGAGLLVSVICYRIMLRIGALPREERVLV